MPELLCIFASLLTSERPIGVKLVSADTEYSAVSDRIFGRIFGRISTQKGAEKWLKSGLNFANFR